SAPSTVVTAYGRSAPSTADDDIADLLEIGVKEVRQLISRARSQAPAQSSEKPQVSADVTGSETTIRGVELLKATDVED
ncbi:hypothetical protein ACFWFQ_36305, partial [Nocardia salmonicida]|uniref:hypothetical protein n=1 Tax=Nocardia salmonicida TaxID=53431 RepID=UPI00366696BB